MRLLSVLITTILVVVALGDEHSHTYKDGDEVVLWMNTVGPYHNRQETYRYYLLPFCRGPRKEIGHYHETLGEELQGVELDYSGLDITFKGSIPSTPYCSVQLTKSHFNAFKYAIINHYWYQMYIDELPMWAVVGEIDDTTQDFTIFTHRKIDIGYNGDQIVDINVTTQTRTPIIIDGEITFTYEVNWKISTISFDKRFDKYLDSSFFQHRIHWFSIFNSFMMVIFLVGLVTMIMLRTLNKDYARYSKYDDGEMDADMSDDYGWKQIHGDVFRAPPNLIIFTSLIGTGHHLAIVSFGCIVFALNGDFYKQRGSFLNTAILMYAITSPICGYVGGALYSKMGGRHWIRQLIGGACLFPSLLVGVALLINTIALFYHASRAFPLSTMLIVMAIALFVIFPLNLAGTLFGRNISGQPNVPCRINTVPRPLPVKKWFMEPFSLSLLGGILPFGSIFIEIYFIFTSFWQYKIYYVFGFMLLVFLILIIVTVCVTIVCIYFLLNSEDYRWQWTSFGAGFTVSFYIILYSIYYYFFKTKMYGLFQTSFYFGYSTLGAISIGIICGTFGYVGASKFVHKIYTTVKID